MVKNQSTRLKVTKNIFFKQIRLHYLGFQNIQKTQRGLLRIAENTFENDSILKVIKVIKAFKYIVSQLGGSLLGIPLGYKIFGDNIVL